MKYSLHQDKKGVSEMISYTLLIIIAIGAATLVYSLFAVYVPKDKPQCNQDVSMNLDNYDCAYADSVSEYTQLNVTLSNQGKFNITAVYVRVGQEGRKTKVWINREESGKFFFTPQLSPNSLPMKFIFNQEDLEALTNNPIAASGNYILEIQPAVKDEKTDKLAACERVITKMIKCD